jgi:hypothetical protein
MAYNGIKIRVYYRRLMSDEGFAKMPYLKKKSFVYVPEVPTMILPLHINTKKAFAEFIFENFGCKEGKKTYYNVRYYRKVSRMGRRMAKLCDLEIWDKDDGGVGYKFVKMGVIKRFGFWDD